MHNESYPVSLQGLVTEQGFLQRTLIAESADEQVTYDVIVVGSGMGGGILADALSDAGLKTLVVEAGSLLYPCNVADLPGPNDVQSVRAFDNAPGSDMRRDVCINFGGRSVFWTGLIPRMAPWELEFWPECVAEYLVADGYSRAESLLRKQTQFNPFQCALKDRLTAALPTQHVDFLPRSYHQPNWPATLRKNLDGRSTGTFSTAALLIDSLSFSGKSGQKNLSVCLNHYVERVSSGNRRANGVECIDLLTMRKRSFKGQVVVLAAGATESPCIALRSGLNDVSDRVGVGLTDHQQAELEYDLPLTEFSRTDEAKFLLRPFNHSPNRNFTCEVLLNPQYWDIRHEDDDIFEEQYTTAKMKGKVKFRFGRELDDHNYVRLVPNALPIVQVRPMNERPMEAEAMLLSREIMAFFGGESAGDESLEYKTFSETYHAGGSLRMGEHGQAVVNTELKFQQYENLYACDLSVFPYIPAANPSLIIAALALRLAGHLSA